MVGLAYLLPLDEYTVSQLVFATLISRSHPNVIIMNVLSAGIAEAGSSQAGDIAFDFKIGHLVGAEPQAQLHGQIIGSIFGAFISCSIYRLYASQYPIPGPLFQIPSSRSPPPSLTLVLQGWSWEEACLRAPGNLLSGLEYSLL
jgi:uncharacterized oligopeptide transporter (OPT) family protein